MTFLPVLRGFLEKIEKFSPSPWDYKQYSWGYGTYAGPVHLPKPNKTITKDGAFNEMKSHIEKDYKYLAKLVKVSLTANQWAALLSFSYNLGSGTAAKLVPYINSGDTKNLFAKWASYFNAGGKPNSGLKERRKKEIDLYRDGSPVIEKKNLIIGLFVAVSIAIVAKMI